LHSIHWGIECASQSYQAIVWHWAVYGENKFGYLYPFFLCN
jgi:hypothetical protein